ncbi:MAG: hypothetical protein KAS32_04535 [Candidatus Peribacteraceae bacterium]|nr:hypothetical protein [Candidatus Peribacteraceae bacterium]
MTKRELAELLNRNSKALRITIIKLPPACKNKVDRLILDNVTAIISLVDDAEFKGE